MRLQVLQADLKMPEQAIVDLEGVSHQRIVELTCGAVPAGLVGFFSRQWNYEGGRLKMMATLTWEDRDAAAPATLRSSWRLDLFALRALRRLLSLRRAATARPREHTGRSGGPATRDSDRTRWEVYGRDVKPS